MIDGHGDDLFRYGNRIESNFSSNVYNNIDHSGLYRHLARCLENVRSYPEPEPYSLEKEIARQNRVEPCNVCVTNGATEAIYLIAQTYRDRCSAVLSPTFSEYADACRLHMHKVLPFFTLDTVPASADIVWMCNPNNPTGEARDIDALADMLQKYSDKLFVIDQSYEYFTQKPTFTISDGISFPNLILLHSMTKKFAIPGLRLGYMTGCRNLIDEVRRHRMPWSVNRVAIDAAMYLLGEGGCIAADIPSLVEESRRLAANLSATGLVEVWPSDTHYMLVKLRMGKACALKEYLAAHHGILIRDASNFEGLDDSYFRIAAQTPAENDRLVDALKKWGETLFE